MKKITIYIRGFLLAMVLCCCLSGCRKKETVFLFQNGYDVRFMNGECFVYDGSEVDLYILHNDYPEQVKSAILKRLQETEAEKVKRPADKLKPPFYGMELYRITEEGTVEFTTFAWSDGYLIMPDGQAYRFPMDFTGWFNGMTANGNYEAVMSPYGEKRYQPCHFYWLLRSEKGWRKEYMKQWDIDQEKGVLDNYGIELELAEAADEETGILRGTLTNHSGKTWTYGNNVFHLSVFLDNEWYQIPLLPDKGYYENSDLIAYLLEDNAVLERSYSVSELYGKLPEGRYRISENGLTGEFMVSRKGRYSVVRE